MIIKSQKISFVFFDTRDFKRHGQFSTEYHNKKEMSGSNIIPYCLFSSFRLSHDDPHRILGEWIIGSFFEGITIIFSAIIINIIIIVTTFEKYGIDIHQSKVSFATHHRSLQRCVQVTLIPNCYVRFCSTWSADWQFNLC